MSRREFIKQGLESAVLLYCAVELPLAHAAETRGESKSPRDRFTSLPSFVDTLIPADSTPSASQLGLDQALLRHAEGIENYSRLLELGCEWLDKTSTSLHGAAFDGLKDPQREAIVTLAETSAENTIARIFFERVRFDLFGLYYASPASWDGLGISSAPQPKGYLDFTRPPSKPARG
jgi:hypothetical protein